MNTTFTAELDFLAHSRQLYDSSTNEPLTQEDLGCTEEEYTDAIAESFGCAQIGGHVRVNGRRVYAA